MDESKKKFYKWRPNLFSLKSFIKNLIRFFIPEFIIKFYKSYNSNKSNISDYYLNDNDAWCVRAIFKVKKSVNT